MPIDSRHPDYEEMAPIWRKCRDVVDGEEAVKAATTLYLPRLDGQDFDDKGQQRYESYLERANFYEATGRTVLAMAGLVMRKAPAVTFPESESISTDSVTMDGTSIAGLARTVVSEQISLGRIGILVDAVTGPGGLTLPYLQPYVTERIVSWDAARLEPNGTRVTVRVVLEEEDLEADPEDRYAFVHAQRWRVLRLGLPAELEALAELVGWPSPVRIPSPLPGEPNAVYWQETWVQKKDASGRRTDEKVLTGVKLPIRNGGRVLRSIPFVPIGVTRLSLVPEGPPIKALCNLNLSHYRTSADHEQGLHYTAIPTPWASGFDPEGDEELYIGSGVAWVTANPAARAGMLEFTGAGLGQLQKALEHKEKLMAAVGSRLLEEPPKGVEAAETVRLRQAGESSALTVIAATASAGLTRALRIAADWAGISESQVAEVGVELNRDINVIGIDPPKLLALMQAVQGGLLSWQQFYRALERGEVFEDGWTMEDEARAIAAGGPLPSAQPGEAA